MNNTDLVNANLVLLFGQDAQLIVCFKYICEMFAPRTTKQLNNQLTIP